MSRPYHRASRAGRAVRLSLCLMLGLAVVLTGFAAEAALIALVR